MSGGNGPVWRQLRSFSLSFGSYMVARLCFGVMLADSKKPLILVENQRLSFWMRGQDLADGMTIFQCIYSQTFPAILNASTSNLAHNSAA